MVCMHLCFIVSGNFCYNQTMNVDSRMNRLIGQLEGIRRMINSGRDTNDVVQQVLAARQALSRIGMLVLKEEMSKNSIKDKKTEKLIEQIFRI